MAGKHRRQRRAHRVIPAQRTPRLLRITATTGEEHVMDEAASAPGSGMYVAACGAAVQAASLTMPPLWQCARCVPVRAR